MKKHRNGGSGRGEVEWQGHQERMSGQNGGYQRTSARIVAGQNAPSDQGNQVNGLHYNGKRGDLSEKEDDRILMSRSRQKKKDK
jgi:hypothetical protein